MKIHLCSDLHFEHLLNEDVDQFFYKLGHQPKVDLLVLAGDITNWSAEHQVRAKKQIDRFAGMYKDVLYVFGNHESYATSIELATKTFEAIGYKNVHLLNNTEKTVQGKHFLGGTLWFPRPDTELYWLTRFSDYIHVDDIQTTAYRLNERFKKDLLPKITPETTVISHHLPFIKSVAPKHRGSNLNCFFYDNCATSMTEHPKNWLHGHTHTACDYDNAGTHVLANPMGYKRENENKDFWKRVLVDI